MNPTTQAHTRTPFGETLPHSPDELYVYLWRMHSAIRSTSLASAVVTAMALKQDAEIVSNLGLLLGMHGYQRSLVTDEELLQKLDETLRRVHPEAYDDEPTVSLIKACPEKQKRGLITKVISLLKGVTDE